ncbi:MAG TPA: YceH family protein [Burkholderiaceae bacterium]|nr:YceH family protein [Burkholderiaceae bacterium]
MEGNANSPAPLSLLETRVLGVLVEKEKTVPDIYPLSLNALTSGCNQKNNRDPVLDVTESEVLVALDALRARTLVIETSGARVTRYAHNLGRALRVPDQAVALLATLMLRGPQTAAQLRANAERLHAFADLSSVEAFLEELAQRPPERGGALVACLPRRPGEREARWMHLLSGAPQEGLAQAPAAAPDLAARVAALAAEVAALRAEVARLRERLP